MTTLLWEDNLEGKSYDEVANLAAVVPQTLVSLSTGATDEVIRPAGLLLTKEQIISLRKYEAEGLALPQNPRTVATYLNFGDGHNGGVGFTQEDFLATFQLVRSHASQWSPLRSRIMLTGTDLRLFGLYMGVYLSTVEEIYADVKAAKALDKYNITDYKQLRAWEMKEGQSFLGLELESDTIPDLGDILDQIFETVRGHLKTVTDIKTDLDSFSQQLSLDVVPAIKLLTLAVSNNTYAADIEALNKIVEARAKDIDELNNEYKALVLKSLEAVSSFSLIGLGVAIYIGVEAENVRAKRNEYTREQERDIRSLESKSKTLGSIARIRGDMQQLTIVALDAEVATKNLIYAWNVLSLYTQKSVEAAANINDSLRLRNLIIQFRLVAAPWGEIHKNADALIVLFQEADEEYKKEYGVQGGRTMRSLIQTNMYPTVKASVFQDSSSKLRDSAMEARLLFMKTGYLPELNDQFQKLSVDVINGSNVLREKALKTEFELKSTLAQLSSLNDELEEGSDEIDDIHEEQAELLEVAQAAVSEMSTSIGKCLMDVNAVYDGKTVQGFKTTLNDDFPKHEAVLVRLNATVVDIEKKQAVISDAVAELNKLGISKVVENVDLNIAKVKELGASPSQVALVMAAVDKLKQDLQGAIKNISFVMMMKESQVLRDRVEKVRAQIAAEKTIMQGVTEKIRLIDVFGEMDNLRKNYVAEYAAVNVVLTQFESAMKNQQSLPLTKKVSGFFAKANGFVGYLNQLSYL
jgi:hypothetical protein